MKNFESIGIDTNKLIPREKLLNLKGGIRVRECWHLTCIGSVGEWVGMYDSMISAWNAGIYWCESDSFTCEPSSDPICDLMD